MDGERHLVDPDGVSHIGRRISKIVPADLSGQAVYFVQAIGANLVKIGWVKDTAKFDQRLIRIQRNCPYPVKLLYLQHGASRSDERSAHKVFGAVHQHGEWFRIEGDLKAFLQLCVVDGARASEAFRGAMIGKVLTLKS